MPSTSTSPSPSSLTRLERPLAALLIALYFALYSLLSLLRHATYHSFGFDLGLYDQVFWNTVHGRWWESTMSLGLPHPHSYFGDHFSPIFFAILPVYALFPHPQTLLVVQTALIALGAVPIYLLARATFPDTGQPLLWVAAYLLFLPVAHINLYDFHETALAILPLGLALHFLERKQTVWFLLSLGAAALVKEEMALVGIGFGLYVTLARGSWRLGLLLVVASLASFLTILYAAIPAFNGGRGFAYFQSRYGQLGASPLQILGNALTRPRLLFQTLIQPRKAAFVAALLGPVLGLPAASGWGILLLLPTLGYLLLSRYEPQFSFTSQYSAPLVPLVLGTAILGLARVPIRFRTLVSAGVLLSSLAFSYAYGNLPFDRRFDPREFLPEARYTAFAPALAKIPAQASVAAENDLTPHLDQRQRVYGIEYEGLADADYVALDMAATSHDPAAFGAQLESVRGQGYEVIATQPGLALLRRIAP